MYYKGIIIQKEVETNLKIFDNPVLSRSHIGDIKFHISMFVTCIVCNKLKPNSNDISEIDLALITKETINNAIEKTYLVYEIMGGTNSVAKGKEFVVELLEQINEQLIVNNKR
jgi:hypothetical protein